jgi:prepilin-type N-terminal cleavage/methylation domain-containing protein
MVCTPALRRPDSQQGMTLIELLISLVLLSLILSILFAALSMGGKSWDAVEAHSSSVQDRRVAWTFMQGIFERAHITDVEMEGERKRLAFGGREDMLELVALMPEGVGLAGHYLIRLEAHSDADEKQLVLRYWLFNADVLAGSGDIPEWRPINDGGGSGGAIDEDAKPSILYGERILLEQLKGIEFSYGEVENGQTTEWRERWDDDVEAPDLVKLSLQFSDGDWPDLVAPLVARSSGGGRGFGRGGGFTPWSR